MGHKQDIMEYLKEHREGAGAIVIDDIIDCKRYIGKDGKEKRMIYIYLARLIKEGLIEPFIKKSETLDCKYYKLYRATKEAWEEERKEKALENIKALYDIMNKKMSPDISLTPDEEKSLEEIEKVI